MKTILAAVFIAASLPALATSDGYVEWSQVSFSAEPGWNVHVERQYGPGENSRISVLEISRNGTRINVPQSAIVQVKNPLLNGLKLLTVCCHDTVKLQIPAANRSPEGKLDPVLWEFTIVDGKFEKSEFAPSSHEF